ATTERYTLSLHALFRSRGEAVTGVTTMKIDAGLDTGHMLLKWETPIGDEETAIELGERLATGGADLLVNTLRALANITPQPQNEDRKSTRLNSSHRTIS